MGDIWGESAQSIETSVNSGGNINYLKLADGDIKKVRILGTLADGLMVRGWLSFGLDSKPIYKTIEETIPPEMLGNDKWGAPQKIWEFWSFPVWNHMEGRVQIWEIRQKSIQKKLFELTNPKQPNQQWTDWRNYDLEIRFNKSAVPAQMYQLQTYPPENLSEAILVNLKTILPQIKMVGLFNGVDPMDGIQQESMQQQPAQSVPFHEQIGEFKTQI
jgi:hypothetical protein